MFNMYGALQKFAVASCFVIAASGIGASRAHASPILVNFDSVDTSGGTVVGAPVLAYLASYGITFSTGFGINAVIEPYPGFINPVTMPNMFGTQGSASAFSYTLSFSTLMDSVSFTRPGANSAIMASWSATAYSSSNAVLSAVGEGLLFNASQASFTLSGPGIDHIIFTDNAFGFAGINFRLDDLTLSPAVPEPGALVVIVAALLLLMGFGRVHRRAAT